MTIHFFTKEDELPGDSRVRAFKVADALNAAGVHCIVHRPSVVEISVTRWPKKALLIWRILKALTTIKKGDIIFLHRAISNKYFFVIMVLYLKIFRRKMVFDFADAIYTHNFYKTMIYTRMADAVIAGSHPLAEWASKYNNNIHIVHSSLQFSDYVKYTKDYSEENKPLIVGWLGTAKDHFESLIHLAPVLQQLAAKTTTPFKFMLVGAGHHQPTHELFDSLPGVETEVIDHLNWKDKTAVPTKIRTFDIGVVPLIDNGVWNRAKLAFKAVEYMALGVPTVSSPMGEINYVIEEGKSGFFANSDDEWVEKLQTLLSDKALRQKIGMGGQARVREDCCYEAITPRFIEIFKTLESGVGE